MKSLLIKPEPNPIKTVAGLLLRGAALWYGYRAATEESVSPVSVRSSRSFSLWARHPAETSAELNVRLGAAEFFPVASRQVRQVRKRRREGNARAAQGTTRVESRYTIQTCDPSVSRTAVRWAHNSSSSAPPRSPAPSFAHFPFGPRPCLYHDDGDKLCQYEIILACGLDSRLNNTT